MTQDDKIQAVRDLIASRPDSGTADRVSEAGLGIAFAEMFQDVVRYVTDTETWYVWDGTRWEEDKFGKQVFALTLNLLEHRRIAVVNAGLDDDARDHALRALTAFEGTRRRQMILTAASAELGIQMRRRDMDVVEHLLVCPNGTVDLRTGELLPSHPRDLNSLRTGVDYDPDARSDLLDLFLKTFIPEPEDQRFVFATLGHTLLGGNKLRQIVLMPGETTSGKSQLMQIIHLCMGGYACTINSSVFRANLDDKPRPDLVAAMFCRLAYASEASKQWSLHADQIKRLTGGDQLPYRNLYQGVVNEVPRFTPMIVTNVMPRISGMDRATGRRIIRLPMDRSLTPEQEDPEVKARFLADEQTRKAVLALLVKGARDDIVNDPPRRFMLAKIGTDGELSHLDEFIQWARDDNEYVTVLDPAVTAAVHFIRVNHMYALYRHWLMSYGDHEDKKDLMSMTAFNRSCVELFGWSKVRSAAYRWVGMGLAQVLPVEIRLVLGSGIDGSET